MTKKVIAPNAPTTTNEHEVAELQRWEELLALTVGVLEKSTDSAKAADELQVLAGEVLKAHSIVVTAMNGQRAKVKAGLQKAIAVTSAYSALLATAGEAVAVQTAQEVGQTLGYSVEEVTALIANIPPAQVTSHRKPRESGESSDTAKFAISIDGLPRGTKRSSMEAARALAENTKPPLVSASTADALERETGLSLTKAAMPNIGDVRTWLAPDGRTVEVKRVQ